MKTFRVALAAALILIPACWAVSPNDDTSDSGVPPDASTSDVLTRDSSRDSTIRDAVVDSSSDALDSSSMDASRDAARDVGLDSTVRDAGVDATIRDSGPDAARDAGVDATVRDSGSPTSSLWINGYYVGYQQDSYPPSAIYFNGLTHVTVGRIVPNSDGTLNVGFDTHDGPAMATTVSGLARAAGKKSILMVGGSGADSGFRASSSASTRSTFIRNLIQAKTSYGYDGLDLDWEPILTSDRPLLTSLVQDLRAASPGIILTVPVTWGNSDAAFISTLSSSLDQVNVMSYGMADSWPGWKSWHSSALAGDTSTTPSSVSRSIQAYVSAGTPASKMGMGIGFYGSCWSGGVVGPGQSLGSGQSVVASDNTMSYTNIMASYFDVSSRRWDSIASVPYLTFTSPRGSSSCTFVSYDDAESIAAKGAYAKSAGIGGTIIWTIAQGAVPGADPASRNPLLEAARQAFAH